MKKSLGFLSRTLAAASLALGAGAVLAAASPPASFASGKSIYGVPVAATAGERVVDLASVKGGINVDCGDVVTFRSAGRSFSWKFDVSGHHALDLRAIAPAGFSAAPLTIYVARNDLERN